MWLTDLQIVLLDRVIKRGAIRITDDRIETVVEGEAPPQTDEPRIEAGGLIALPGLVDLYGDMLEREIEPRPGSLFPLEPALHEYDKRLAGAGITTSCAVLALDGPHSHWKSRRPEFMQQVGAILSAQQAAFLTDLRIHLRCEGPIDDPAAILDLLDSAHPVAVIGLRGAAAHQAALIEAAQSHMAMLGVHDLSRPEHVDAAHALGAQLICFPRALDVAHAARAYGMHVAVGAPNVVRGGSHAGGMDAREAVRSGLVDLLVANESPISLLQAPFVLAQDRVLPLHESVALASRTPAALLGLRDHGSIAPGMQADLVLVEREPLPHVRMTIRRGVPIYRRGL